MINNIDHYWMNTQTHLIIVSASFESAFFHHFSYGTNENISLIREFLKTKGLWTDKKFRMKIS